MGIVYADRRQSRNLLRARIDPAIPRRIGELGSGDRMHLPCHAIDREAVGAIRRDLQFEHRFIQRKDFGRRGPRLRAVLEHEDPIVLIAQAQLRLGADHPAREHSPELCLADLHTAGHDRTREGDDDGLAGRHVRGTTDDRPGPRSVVDLADAEAIGIGMGTDLEGPPDHEAPGVSTHPPAYPLDLGTGHCQTTGEVPGLESGIAVLGKPGNRDPHENCSSILTSFSNRKRRSPIP